MHFPVVIIGGGMVGSSLALALAQRGIECAVVETAISSGNQHPSFDDRSVALSHGSSQILQTLGLWAGLVHDAEPIKRIHVSQKGHAGVTRIDSSESGLPALGYVVENRLLGQHFDAALGEQASITLLAPATVTQLEQSVDKVTLTIAKQQQQLIISADRVIAADGAGSPTRGQLQIPTEIEDYQQSAVTCNLRFQQPHHNQAFERFTTEGPLALLPLTEKRMNLVWCMSDHKARELQAADSAVFISRLQETFGRRLGRLEKLGTRHSFPLRLTRSRQVGRGRVALIGNAAQSLHPVAGQGFNLGLRDCARMAQVLAQTSAEGYRWLKEFDGITQADRSRTIAATDWLVKGFSNSNPLLGAARGLALGLMEFSATAKQGFAHYATGLAEAGQADKPTTSASDSGAARV